MRKWKLSEETKERYLPAIKDFIKQAEEKKETNEVEFIGRKLNPYQLWKILESLGYENTDINSNGWQMDF